MQFPRSPLTSLRHIIEKLVMLPGTPGIDHDLMLTGIMLMQIIDAATEADHEDILLDPTQLFGLLLIAASEQSKKCYPLTKTVRKLAAIIIEEEAMLAAIREFPVETPDDRSIFLCTAGMFEGDITLHCSLILFQHARRQQQSQATNYPYLDAIALKQIIHDVGQQPRLFGWIVTD